MKFPHCHVLKLFKIGFTDFTISLGQEKLIRNFEEFGSICIKNDFFVADDTRFNRGVEASTKPWIEDKHGWVHTLTERLIGPLFLVYFSRNKGVAAPAGYDLLTLRVFSKV